MGEGMGRAITDAEQRDVERRVADCTGAEGCPASIHHPGCFALTQRQTDDLETASAPEREGAWVFDASVAERFDDMLARSIPDYQVMRDLVTDTASWFMDRRAQGGRAWPVVVDLGCSRGAALAPLVDRWGARARFLGVDASEPMLAAARERFAGMVEAGVIRLEEHDLRLGYPWAKGRDATGAYFSSAPTVILSVLTLQFVPIEYRHRLLRECRQATMDGGCMIIVEKVLGETLETNEVLVDVYHGLKRGHGYTQEAVDRKRLALEGVLVPLTAAWNEDLLRRSGWEPVEVLWSWANFRAWLAVAR